MKDYSKVYEELMNPIYIRSLFKTDEEFEVWCLFRTITELEEMLVLFESVEDYENCIVIRDTIQEKKIKSLLN